MYAEGPYYQVCGYFGDTILSEFSYPVDGPCDAEMIERVQDFHQAPDADAPNGHFIYADLFYCSDRTVTLIGTWVTSRETGVWHPSGWADRPKASKEKALRFLHERGRPA